MSFEVSSQFGCRNYLLLAFMVGPLLHISGAYDKASNSSLASSNISCSFSTNKKPQILRTGNLYLGLQETNIYFDTTNETISIKCIFYLAANPNSNNVNAKLVLKVETNKKIPNNTVNFVRYSKHFYQALVTIQPNKIPSFRNIHSLPYTLQVSLFSNKKTIAKGRFVNLGILNSFAEYENVLKSVGPGFKWKSLKSPCKNTILVIPDDIRDRNFEKTGLFKNKC